MKPETIALHHGYVPNGEKAVAVPIHQTSSYAFDNAQHAADFSISRYRAISITAS